MRGGCGRGARPGRRPSHTSSRILAPPAHPPDHATRTRRSAVVPYYGYARQDRKLAARVPISAADVAQLLEAMGVDRVIALDLRRELQGFFAPRVPVDNIGAATVGVDYFVARHKLVNPVVVAPHAGGVYRA